MISTSDAFVLAQAELTTDNIHGHFRRRSYNKYVPAVYKLHQRQKRMECPEKDKARRVLLTFIWKFLQDHPRKNVSLLTLPGVGWVFERQLMKDVFQLRDHWDRTKDKRRNHYQRGTIRRRNPLQVFITACERDWDTFCLSSLLMPVKNAPGLTRPLKQTFSESLNCQVMKGDSISIINTDIFEFCRVCSDRRFDIIWLDTHSPIDYVEKKLQFAVDRLKPNKPTMLILTVLACRERKRIPNRVEYIKSLLPEFALEHHLFYGDTSPMLQLIFAKNI